MNFHDSYSSPSRQHKKEKFHDSYSSARKRPRGYDRPKEKYHTKRWYDYLVFWKGKKHRIREEPAKKRKKPQMGLFDPKTGK